MQPTLAALMINADRAARDSQNRHRHPAPPRKRRARRWF
jgi:hypothetical protein